MNAKKLIATSILLIAAGSALADGSQSYPPEAPVTGTKTRAEVISELRQAQAAGELQTGDRYEIVTTPATGTRDRADVRAEALSANQNQDQHGRNS